MTALVQQERVALNLLDYLVPTRFSHFAGPLAEKKLSVESKRIEVNDVGEAFVREIARRPTFTSQSVKSENCLGPMSVKTWIEFDHS